ncbi:HAD-like protein [Aspergillus neoniger CBS 115656]|uniref:HAD-like protein n=1 Tax=Aspergillus neoniger (strain CBS 115656) TaxID=1448310 RepID=A0A318Y2G9_ASPNB|nr:HAD-like protein [Aspergillus neoniger CBS 115656]PYH28545.1 HAD-like protein [Aspergillus neoniger CBS 115656]
MPHSEASRKRMETSANVTSGAHGKQTQIRVLVACPRSGSTLFMRIFRELPHCAVTSRLILQGNYHKFSDQTLARIKPDYTIISHPEAHPVYQKAVSEGFTTLVTKEELGHEFFKGECDFNVLPNRDAYEKTQPAFLVRDPVRVFDTWKNMGWGDLYSFFICYRSLFKMLTASPTPQVVLYEQLVANPRDTVTTLAKYWGIEYDDGCLEFRQPLGDYLFNGYREQSIYQGAVPDRLFNRVKSHTHVEDFHGHGLLSALEIEHIEAELGGLYLEAYGPQLNPISSLLSGKTWFGFDLDDTLHEFRKASAHASHAVFAAIRANHPEANNTIDDLQTTYRDILRSNTANAFTDGKSSEDYRSDRFRRLLEAHGHAPSLVEVEELLAGYKSSLRAALTLKAGALRLLQKLKSHGKKIVIVTEGPQDAQEWTVSELGLQPFIDILVTTNEVGVSKVDGLFSAVLEKHSIVPTDMVYVGDSEQRDIEPARAAGIDTVLYDENSNCRLQDPHDLRLNSLQKLEYLMARPWAA